MRILFIASRLPHLLVRGDQVRSYHFLRLLNLRHEITLVRPISYPLDKRAEQTIAHLYKRWIAVLVRSWETVKNVSRSLFSRLPLQVLYFCPPALQKTVQRLVREQSFGLIHVQMARMAPAVAGIDHIPKILDFIDALSMNMRFRANVQRWPLKLIFQLESKRMSRYEQELVLSFDQQIISSPADREVIGPYESLHIVPNGVNIEDFPYNEDGREDKVIVFTGRMGYFPNAEAAVYFATQVFPKILQEEPNARFLIVGDDPPRMVRKLARLPGIEVTGYVPCMQDYLRRATIAVAPMRVGTGIQNKVLEAMACGAPVVATPLAAQALEGAMDGEHLVVADDPHRMAERIVYLLKDPGLRIRIARNARRLVEERYTWEHAVAKVEEVYLLALSHHRG